MKTIFVFLVSVGLGTLAYASNGDEPITGDSTTSIEPEVSFYDTSAIFTEDWSNTVTYSYPKVDYKDSTILALTSSQQGFIFPIERETTSGFGRRHSGQHKGIDIPTPTGTEIVAAFDGKVRYARYNSGGFGYLVIIRHTNGIETYYAHLSKLKVKPNQIVKAGELIGLSGSTGRSYSPHLHFEMRYKHKAFNPELLLDLENYCLKNEEVMACELLSRSKYHSHGSFQQSTANLNEGTVYTIKSGDSLSKIAAKYGTSVNALCSLNGMTRDAILQIGQKIRIK